MLIGQQYSVKHTEQCIANNNNNKEANSLSRLGEVETFFLIIWSGFQTTDNSCIIITSYFLLQKRYETMIFFFVLLDVGNYCFFYVKLTVIFVLIFFFLFLKNPLPSRFALLTSCDDCFSFENFFVKLIFKQYMILHSSHINLQII